MRRAGTGPSNRSGSWTCGNRSNPRQSLACSLGKTAASSRSSGSWWADNCMINARIMATVLSRGPITATTAASTRSAVAGIASMEEWELVSISASRNRIGSIGSTGDSEVGTFNVNQGTVAIPMRAWRWSASERRRSHNLSGSWMKLTIPAGLGCSARAVLRASSACSRSLSRVRSR